MVSEITLSLNVHKQTNWQVRGKSTFRGGEVQTLKALVITPNSKTTEFGSILAIARSEARKREQSKENPSIRALKFFPELGIYVAVYEALEKPNEECENNKVR